MYLSSISKNQFVKLSRAELSSKCFFFDGIIYQKVDGVDLGSLLSPSLADAFIEHYELIWLNDYPDNLSLCIIKDMLTMYLFYFDLFTTLKD